MGRISIADSTRYDDLGDGLETCYYCDSDKVRGFDYSPHPSALIPGQRGTRVRCCGNCLPRIHYHTIKKGIFNMPIETKLALLQPRRTNDSAQVKGRAFSLKDNLLVPSDMSFFADPQGAASQFFSIGPKGPTEQIERTELEAAQLCIGATLLGVRCQKLDDAWLELQSTISPGAFEAIRKRLVESP